MIETTHTPGTVHPHRVDWVDIAKGLCIILVVMMHSTLGVVDRMGEAGFMEALVAFAAPFRMPDFFLISGLFLARVIDRPWRRFLDRKVVHFAYFYLLWVVIQFAFKGPALALSSGVEAALAEFALAFVQPFGTLWFIYALPVFFVVTRLLRGVNPWLVLGGAALLEIAPVHTGWVLADEFAARYVYFFAGYLLAERIFELAERVRGQVVLSLAAIVGWAVVNGLAVSAGLSGLPILSLGLGAAGAMVIVSVSALLADRRWSTPLRWLGAHSIVVYLAFFLPMAASRTLLLKSGLIDSGAVIALVVTTLGVVAPVLIHGIVRKTGHGRFLFERPAWASIDRAAKAHKPAAPLVPAE